MRGLCNARGYPPPGTALTPRNDGVLKMNSKLPTINPDLNDPIVEELHAVRESLIEKYGGDLHAYSVAARAKAVALGFQFTAIKKPRSASTDT
jgi:hypothetical protein